MGRKCSPSWSAFRRGCFASPRTKDAPGSIEWPVSSRGQRHMKRTDNLVAAFCCFNIDSGHSCKHATAFLGQKSDRYRDARLPSREREWVHTLLGTLRFVILNPSHQPRDKTEENCSIGHANGQTQAGGGQRSDKSLGHRNEYCSLFCEALLNSRDHEFSSPRMRG